jgi:hypothetical protein
VLCPIGTTSKDPPCSVAIIGAVSALLTRGSADFQAEQRINWVTNMDSWRFVPISYSRIRIQANNTKYYSFSRERFIILPLSWRCY